VQGKYLLKFELNSNILTY